MRLPYWLVSAGVAAGGGAAGTGGGRAGFWGWGGRWGRASPRAGGLGRSATRRGASGSRRRLERVSTPGSAGDAPEGNMPGIAQSSLVGGLPLPVPRASLVLTTRASPALTPAPTL